jgi:negative regulator of sigma-B (phosphoserine phosphatase)
VFEMNEEVLTSQLDLYMYQVPKKGQSCCGDSYITIIEQDYAVIALADGLGSGEQAKISSESVMEIVRQFHNEDIHSLLKRCNQALKSSRGAAVAIAKIYFPIQEVVYSCVGNIRFIIVSPSGKTTYPLPKVGYLSGKPITPSIQRFYYAPNSFFIMNSDGIRTISSKEILPYGNSLPELIRSADKDNSKMDDATMLIGKIKQ